MAWIHLHAADRFDCIVGKLAGAEHLAEPGVFFRGNHDGPVAAVVGYNDGLGIRPSESGAVLNRSGFVHRLAVSRRGLLARSQAIEIGKRDRLAVGELYNET